MGLVARARVRLHAWFRALLVEHSSPRQLALATLVGVMVGFTPLYGFHLLLCIALAWALRLNRVTIYAAAHVSIPPMIPFIAFVSVQVGEMILHGRYLHLHLADFKASPAHLVARFFIDWLIGGVAVGGVAGLALAAGVYQLALARARAAGDPIRAAIAEASRRYKRAPRGMRFYAWFKYRMDPCYRAIAPLVPDGSFTVDLGAGLGMLPLLLALLPGERRALGIEWDERKLAAGRLAVDGLERVELRGGDARTVEIPDCDVITIVDVLHYYAPEAQRALLARCSAALRDGGRLLVRDADAGKRGGGLTRSVENAAVASGWNRGEGRPVYRGADELRAELEALGFTVTVAPVAGKLHPGNVLFAAQKK